MTGRKGLYRADRGILIGSEGDMQSTEERKTNGRHALWRKLFLADLLLAFLLLLPYSWNFLRALAGASLSLDEIY